MTFWEKIKDNWPQITVVSTVLLLLMVTYVEVFVGSIAMTAIKSDAAKTYIHAEIDAKITATLTEKNYPSDVKIAEMDGNIGANKESIKDGEKELDKLYDKIERAFDILTE